MVREVRIKDIKSTKEALIKLIAFMVRQVRTNVINVLSFVLLLKDLIGDSLSSR